MSSPWDYLIIALAALAAGAINALAGGGTLITFPVLTALGIPAVAANVTNTVSLCPGYLGATLAQRGDLRSQKKRLWLLVPISALGGIAGGLLLLNTGEKLFRDIVPWLILLAAFLLAIGDPVRAWLNRRAEARGGEARERNEAWIGLGIFPAAIYGGYFGAGLSVIVLATLGLLLDESLTKLNALKQAIALSVNVAAAILFVFSGHVNWGAAAVMAVGALTGGALGGKLAGRIPAKTLRWTVVTIGVVVSLIYLLR